MRIAVVLGLVAMLGAAGPATPNDLSWMHGDWVAVSGERWTEEHWSRPRAGEMIGYSRSGRGNMIREFEFLRIAVGADGTLAYHAQPKGRPPIRFGLISSDAREAVFENPAHDYPTRIHYRRDGKSLVATISGPDGRKPQSWTYRQR